MMKFIIVALLIVVTGCSLLPIRATSSVDADAEVTGVDSSDTEHNDVQGDQTSDSGASTRGEGSHAVTLAGGAWPMVVRDLATVVLALLALYLRHRASGYHSGLINLMKAVEKSGDPTTKRIFSDRADAMNQTRMVESLLNRHVRRK